MEDTNIYTEHSIRTFTGKVFDITILDPETICIEDIAHALAHTARFGGHLDKLYSVAQHSCHVAAHVSKENKLAALLHDASEAYIGDMPSPFKKLMPDYQKIEDRIMSAIALKFGFEYPLPKEVKAVDRDFLLIEWDSLVLKNNEMKYYNPDLAKATFLSMFYAITTEKKNP